MQSPLRRITNTTEEGISVNPAISGDGRIVGFESTEDIAHAGGPESFRAIRANVSVDPPTFLQLGATRAPAPAISQDGSRIAFASKDNPLGSNPDGNSEIFLHDGAKLIQLTNTSPGDIANRVVNGNFLPSISDDGRFIAFSSNRDLTSQNGDGNLEIFICDTVNLSFTQLTNSSAIVGFTDAKISGNGAAVAYIRDNGSTPGASRDLLLQNRVGAPALKVLAAGAPLLAMTYGRAISDDGLRVVWSAETATNSTQVFLFDGRNNLTRQITALGARTTEVAPQPTISGDGSRIAFATRRTVISPTSDVGVDLYTYDIPSGTFTRVTNAPSSATAEVVSSLNDDGSIIAFSFPRVLSGAVSNSDLANNSEIYVTGTTPRPAFGTLTILNGASFGNEPATTEAVAPDSIAVARGGALAFSTQQSQRQPDGTFPLVVGGTQVTVNGIPAQIFFVSPTQVNFHVPAATALGTAEVVITNSEGFQSRGNIAVLRAAPGVFTFGSDGLFTGEGVGEGAILNADTLTRGPFDPSSGNLRLIIFSTGVRNGSPVTVTAGGRALTVESIVHSPTMPGMDEIHVLVPADLRGAGTVDLVVRADTRDSNPVSVSFKGDSSRDIVINEFLADPPATLTGDANHDGVRSDSEDEFIELANTTTRDIDIGGYQIFTRGSSDVLQYTFAAGTILPSCTAIVVFGGGNPNPANPVFGGAQIVKTNGLSLINSGGVITLRDASGNIVNFVSYGGSTGLDGNADQSLTRSPDLTGNFTLHGSAPGNNGAFSPGTKLTGAPFTPCAPIARIDVSPAAATMQVGGHQQFTARAFDSAGNEVFGVIFFWQSSNTAVATINQNGLATGVSVGTVEIRASGRGITSAPATLTVNPATPVLTSVTITPVAATIGVGETQEFTAQAKDQFGQDIGGVTITFASNNTVVATVDSVSSTSGTGSATATVTGRATGTAQITATANNGSYTITSSPATLTVEAGAGQVLISEFRTRGTNGAADEFVEIYNPTTATVIIGGLKIRASNNTGTVSDRVTITAGTSLGSGCHYLLANSSASGYSGSVAANQTYATGIADDGGIAITRSNNTSIIDAVGMSSGSAYKEGTTLAPLTNSVNQSYERKPGGPFGNGTDTNNNAADFFLNPSSSNPQNSSSGCLDLTTADISITKTDSPDPVTTGADVTYTITVTNNGAANAQSVVVTDNLPAAVTFVSCGSTAGGVCGGSGNNRTISFPSLPSGASATITLIATANSAPGSTITNTATVSAATSDSNAANNTATAITSVQAPPPLLTINDVSAAEGNSGTTIFSFTVSLSQPAPAGGVTFDIATADNTAKVSTNDYVARSLTSQTIPAGQQTYAFDVTVNGDTVVEPNETFFVNVSNVVGAVVGDAQGVGTIQNDDTASLVISQLYGGGGNADATYRNDFVEIFNRGTATVDFGVTPYSVQYAGATSNFGSNKLDLISGTVAPGKYFLVQLGGGAIGAVLPAPDATGSINMAASSGKVALVAGTTSLATATCPGDDNISPFNPSNANIADFVGYGSANCYEGPTGPAPSPDAVTAAFRKSGGCIDTNNNAADFLLASPFPRNTSSPANNCVAGPAPNLTISDATVTEGDSGTVTATFTVSLSAPANATDVTFDIATADGTAQDDNPASEDNDYVARSLNAQVIPAGAQTYTFSVTVNGNTVVEPNETFFVNVTNVNGAIVTDGQGLGTILNDDLPALSINDVSQNEGNEGTTTFTFTVSLTAPAPSGGVTFDIATQDNTATVANNDYVAKSLVGQTIPAGQQTYNFAVTVNGDVAIESNESFFVNVTNVSGATVADSQGTGTILNDDSPTLSITDVSANEGNSGTTVFTFTVSSSLPAPPGGITFDIATADGTAHDDNPVSEDNDYVAKSLTGQTIPETQTSYTFDVTVNGDTLGEASETFFVNISNVTGASVSDSQGIGTILNDDGTLVVISQVYGGGGNSGAPYQNDFIELFNRGANPVDITGWSVQYASATGTSWSVTPICPTGLCSIAPGKYFLVQEAGGVNGVGLPTPDATGTIGMATSGGKVALAVNTTPLTLSGCPLGSAVMDFVGYGSADCFEGSGPAPAHSNTTADLRAAGGCIDTNQNAADFATSAPTPRNSSSPANDCTAADVGITKTDSPDPVTTGFDVTYTITVTNNGPATAQSVLVTDNLPGTVTFVSCSSTGGGVCGGTGNNRTVSFTSLASGASAEISLVATVNGAAGSTIDNTATVTAATSDPNAGNNSANAATTVQAVPPSPTPTPTPATSVIINEVDVDQTGTDTLEFVELYDGG
ncbi:MAG: hypothetical protein QOD75_1126, partial [Blastocatellia bacterium]|nr:hypothetical protein [Blastocatellia bacterium]